MFLNKHDEDLMNIYLKKCSPIVPTISFDCTIIIIRAVKHLKSCTFKWLLFVVCDKRNNCANLIIITVISVVF